MGYHDTDSRSTVGFCRSSSNVWINCNFNEHEENKTKGVIIKMEIDSFFGSVLVPSKYNQVNDRFVKRLSDLNPFPHKTLFCQDIPWCCSIG
jgi:hypothetical protein